ncbi:hypothetical protein SLS60_002155 [Paraconiothyrium brasiliense]|uniref:SET domain-containing protein n=1 Tax=Paraconiothyrium brasiliense TaxID=300254 RepID=A0ABR3S1C2_9PLEO
MLWEKPLLTVPCTIFDKASWDRERILALRLRTLSNESRRIFRDRLEGKNLAPNKNKSLFPSSEFFDRYSMPCGHDVTEYAIFSTICFLNHSCFPNAISTWNSTAKHRTVHALRPIRSGQEITISYFDFDGVPRAKRRSVLREAFEFQCNCRACSLLRTQASSSDHRRTEIQRLTDGIDDPLRIRHQPKKVLDDCRSVLDHYNKEFDGNPGALAASIYFTAFQTSNAHGDNIRASVFADRAYAIQFACEGETSYTQELLSYAEDPSKHKTRYSSMWIPRSNKMPTGLDEAEFEDWLFRRLVRLTARKRKSVRL